MTPKRVSAFRIEDELLDGMRALWERDGVQPAEQVRRAIRAYLDTKGVKVKAQSAVRGKRPTSRTSR
jgi:hypothetical protein